MLTDPLFYKLLLVVLVWLCLMLHVAWPSERTAARPTPPKPVTPPHQRSREPKPFAGFTQKPHCAACEQGPTPRPQAPSAPPPPIIARRGRPRQIDTSHHFCPHPDCPYFPITVGSAWATSAPTGIRVAAPGVSSIAVNVKDMCWRPTARFFMANRWRSTSSCTCSTAWLQA